MRRPLRLLLRALAWLMLLAALALFAAWLALRASLPEVDGERHIAGLHGTVQVGRDPDGVPVISGSDRLDVARATGFVHAQERFFQMDLMRRAAAGELSALLGRPLLATDRRLRVHRFRARAAQALAAAVPADLALLRAYSEGVNAGLNALAARPFEYFVLRARPEPWRPEDCLLVVYSMWLDLQGGSLRQELQQERLHAVLPDAVYRLVALSPSAWDAALDGSVLAPPPLPAAADYDLRLLDATLFDDGAGPQANAPRVSRTADAAEGLVGSNNWVLSGQRTRSGHALVANDMHLGLRVPNTWYRARLVATAAGIDATGVTLPGVPTMIAGSNGHVAWGFTNSYGDFQDLVIVEPAGGDPDSYLSGGGRQTLERHREIIEVAGGGSDELVVEETIWGPLIGKDSQGRRLALAWTAHRAGAINLRLAAMESAHTVDEAVEIAAAAGIPAQNALIGDTAGRVAWVIAGRIPARRGFDPGLPASWAKEGVGWDGWVSVGRQPEIRDPPGGAAWSANARVVGGDMLALIGDGGYAHGARSHEIRDDLAGMSQAVPVDFLEIHLDDHARYVAQWQPLLESALSDGGEVHTQALALVRLWSGRAAAGDAGYRLLREFERIVTERAFAVLTVEARRRWPDFDWRPPSRFSDVAWRLVSERPANLLDPRYPTWDAWLAASADAAIASSEEGCETLAKCTWGRANTTRIRHPLSAALPWLSALLDMPATEMPGDWSTPRVQSPTFGASERFAVEPGREQDGYFHMPGGQSGHPLSPYYRAGHDAWVRGEPTPFLPGPAEHVLTLSPE
jgi:penicillin amidase